MWSVSRIRALGAASLLAAGIALSQKPTAPPISFRNVVAQSGIRFVLDQSPTPQKHMIETMPGGLAAFDYNNDGRTDLYFTNGALSPTLVKQGDQFCQSPLSQRRRNEVHRRHR